MTSLNLEKIDDHENLLISQKEAVDLTNLAQHMLERSAAGALTEIHIWPDYAMTLAIVLSTGLDKLDQDGRIKE